MTSLVSNQTHVGCLVATVVLGKSARPFQKEVERLLSNNGPEWLASRQKAIWTAANHLRNGDRSSAQSVYQENSISYHRSDMTPKGPYRPVVRGYVGASRPSVIRRYAAVLRFYSTLVLPELSAKQSAKAEASITAPHSGTVPEDLSHFALNFGRALGNHVPLRPASPASLAPNTYRYSRVKLSKMDRKVPLRTLALSLMTEGFVPEELEHLDPFPLLRRKANPEGPMGRIGVIQEQGAKARVVAMPSARLQYVFKPLHDHLASLDSRLSSSVLKDQQKAVYGLMAHMQDYPAYSTDLSSATDRFPRSLSMDLLRGMGMGEWASALDTVSKGDWESPWGNVSYSVGQPMGLYSSFPLFHLSNQMVASYAAHKAAGVSNPSNPLRLGEFEELFANRNSGYTPIVRFPNGNPYYVLGDDIVFSDPRVRDQYVATMTEMGVGISETKSFSGRLTEFAGFIMTESKGKPFGFRPYKPPEGQRVSNPVDFLAALGTKARVINPYWEEQVSYFSRTWSQRSPDLSPWLTQERDPVRSQWDPAALDNEFLLLSEKYPDAVPSLTPGVKYSTGEITDPSGGTFTIVGLSRDRSRDLPRFQLETNRERLGEQPKHPRRQPSPLQSDPLIRKEKEERAKEIQDPPREVSPREDSPKGEPDLVKDRKKRITELIDRASRLPSPPNGGGEITL